MNARDEAKLVGTAQRVLPGAWLFSSLVTVGDEEVLRPVLTAVYGCLDLPFDPASVGSLSAESGGAVTTDAVLGAIADAWGVRRAQAVAVEGATLERAIALVDDHRPH